MTADNLEKALRAENHLAITLQKFAGQWVAVHNHQVVAHADTLSDLLEPIEATKVDRVLEVDREPGGACFF